ncbi:MAG: hypothetical protein ACREQL_01600 [Candidatus Binatia bacterium]
MANRCLAASLIVVALAAPAPGAKWEGGCPRVKQKLTRVGKGFSRPGGGTYPAPFAISRYFEHVGHELTFYLRDYDVGHYGGFSTDPDGNTFEVTFTPVFGPEIPLPPVPVTAVSPAVLRVVVPDTRPILGRLLVGPARFVVKVGGTPFFQATRQVVLPPMNNVHALVMQGYEVEALAAMDHRGLLWIPLDFSEFGQTGSPLPECPTVLTPVTAFAVDFSLKKGDDQAIPYVSFGNLKKNRLFLGDYLLFGLNMYGNKLSTKLDVTPFAGKSVVLCGLNDALQIVVMIGLRNPAIGKGSELLPLVADGSPLSVKMENVSLDPDYQPVLSRLREDSVHLPCYPAE